MNGYTSSEHAREVIDELFRSGSREQKRGDKAFAGGHYRDAVKHYLSAYDPKAQRQSKAELAHKLATAYKRLENYNRYLQFEEQASALYAQICTNQSADFLKAAGDTLRMADEDELAARAYRLASHYYASASTEEGEEGLSLVWSAWSIVCKSKATRDASPVPWSEAARTFTRAAEKSKNLETYRKAKAIQCTALCKIYSTPTAANLNEAVANFKKAARFEQFSARARICLLATQTLAASEAEAPKFLRQLTPTLDDIECPSELKERLHIATHMLNKKGGSPHETLKKLYTPLRTLTEATAL